MTREPRRLTPQAFEAVKALLDQMDNQNLLAAEFVLVRGSSFGEAAALATVDPTKPKARQAVLRAVDSVWAAYQTYQKLIDAEAVQAGAIPEGWISVRLVLPPALLPMIAEQVKAYATSIDAESAARTLAVTSRRISTAKRGAAEAAQLT